MSNTEKIRQAMFLETQVSGDRNAAGVIALLGPAWLRNQERKPTPTVKIVDGLPWHIGRPDLNEALDT